MLYPQIAALVNTAAHVKELNQGCSITENHNSISVTMETTAQSNTALDFDGKEAAPGLFEQDEGSSALDEVYLKSDPSDSSVKEPPEETLLTGPPMETKTFEYSEADVSVNMPDQKEPYTQEQGHEGLNRNESITSSVSDTLSSADSVYENEAHKKQEPPQQVPEQDPTPEQDPEPELEPEPLEDNFPGPEHELLHDQLSGLDLDPVLDQYPGSDLEYPGSEQELLEDDFPEPEAEQLGDHYPGLDQDTELEQYPAATLYTDSILDLDPELDPEAEPYSDIDLYPEPEGQDPEPDPYDVPEYFKEDPDAHEVLFAGNREESRLEQCIREEVTSDGSNESCHDLDPEDMDECLRVEIAAASSDSDTDEKWRTIFSSSINKEDDDSYLDSLQLSAQELFVKKVEVTDLEAEEGDIDVPQMEEVLEQPEDVLSFPIPTQEVKYNPLGIQSLSKISEDEGENGRDANQNHTIIQEHSENNSNTDSNKKVPKDFCVIQKTMSENVSTEHVDFQLARKQWREMEEQTKNRVVLPTRKLHSSHSFMYTPVRNIERTNKKAHNLENLNLFAEYPHTQFSPCSEDSGLGDSSYRSPYDDVETPIEREIRMSLEREENFRKERGLSRMGKSTDCAPSRSIPRSISTPLTPSFIITSSPTKEPLKHDLSAHNVIIVDPGNESTQRLGKDLGACSAEWRSEDHSPNLIILETSNLIIRSASEYSLNKACEQPEEKMFLNNPFFKLRSRSTISLVDEEIKMAKQREEELRKERANLYGKDVFLSNHMDTLSFDNSGMLF